MITALTVFIAKWRRERGQARSSIAASRHRPSRPQCGRYHHESSASNRDRSIDTQLARSILYASLCRTRWARHHPPPTHGSPHLRQPQPRLWRRDGGGLGAPITAARLIFPGWDAQTYFVHPNIVTITIVALAMLSSPAQKFFNRAIDPYLYRGIEHAIALRAATRRLSRLMQPAELASELRQILAEVLVPESFTLLVRSFGSDSFEQLSSERIVTSRSTNLGCPAVGLLGFGRRAGRQSGGRRRRSKADPPTPCEA